MRRGAPAWLRFHARLGWTGPCAPHPRGLSRFLSRADARAHCHRGPICVLGGGDRHDARVQLNLSCAGPRHSSVGLTWCGDARAGPSWRATPPGSWCVLVVTAAASKHNHALPAVLSLTVVRSSWSAVPRCCEHRIGCGPEVVKRQARRVQICASVSTWPPVRAHTQSDVSSFGVRALPPLPPATHPTGQRVRASL